ncbi:MAG: LacI family DNA-binding transcriptional regulator [Acidimicrobiia bacterium]
MSERTTLKDVAREAGVHVSTASRALNPRTASVVNSETVERVAAIARRLGYRPHPLARGLRTNRTMSVGMVIPDVENPLFGPMIAGAESVLASQGYSVLIGNADQGEIDAEEVVSNLLEHRVDGLLLATAARSDAWIAQLVEQGVAVVLLNRASDESSAPAIVGDDHAGIGLGVRHLAELGHRHIAHVAGPSILSTGLQRRESFLSWMQFLGLDADPDQVEEANWFQVEPGFRAGLELMRRRPDITAIVAANDLLALGCYRAVRSLGLEVPTDVSVTGYNDIPLLDLMQPALTAVRVPYRQMGTQGAAALIAGMSGASEQPASIKLTPTLMVRASTAPPRVPA